MLRLLAILILLAPTTSYAQSLQVPSGSLVWVDATGKVVGSMFGDVISHEHDPTSRPVFSPA